MARAPGGRGGSHLAESSAASCAVAGVRSCGVVAGTPLYTNSPPWVGTPNVYLKLGSRVRVYICSWWTRTDSPPPPRPWHPALASPLVPFQVQLLSLKPLEDA